MPRPLLILNNATVNSALTELNNLKEEGIVSNRLRAIISASKNGIKTVSEVFDINPSSLHRWIVRFKNNGIDGLKKIKKNQNRFLLKQDDLLLLETWIRENPNITIKSLQHKILKELDIKIGKSALYNYVKKLGFSHITARPQHYKQNKEELEQFKKKSTRDKRKKSK